MKNAKMFRLEATSPFNKDNIDLSESLKDLIHAGFYADMSSLYWLADKSFKRDEEDAGEFLGGVKMRTTDGFVILVEMYERYIYVLAPEEMIEGVTAATGQEPMWVWEYDDKDLVFNPFVAA